MVAASTALSVAALAAGVTLMLVVHVLVIFWALRRAAMAPDLERPEEDAGDGKGKGKGLSAEELQTLPCHDFEAAVGGGGDCAVCLEAFGHGHRCRRLPRCGHSFHAPCVDSWLMKSSCCPVCRADVVDRPKGEPKVAGDGEGEAPAMTLEMAERRGPAALGAVAERLQQYSWSAHAATVLH